MSTPEGLTYTLQLAQGAYVVKQDGSFVGRVTESLTVTGAIQSQGAWLFTDNEGAKWLVADIDVTFSCPELPE